ncbi:MAG TPA: UBA/TS-N domain protein [Candidatus Blautia faecipullorum]|nr:UBA/TS-N domain protein [Candidatus Blautia faecipullorum]
MEQLEKVEKLRERANVTYEEAKEALEASGWDLLDAMVYLEKQGKVKSPAQETYTTNYEEQTQYVSVKDKVQEQEETGSESFFKKLSRFAKILLQKSKDNSFYITRRDEEIFHMPVWALALLLLFTWKLLIPVMIVALFFECRYSFKGKDNLDGVNKAMDKASDLADRVKDGYEKL